MTPSYVFDLDIFNKRIDDIRGAIPGIPLVYSIKANPFLLPYLPDTIAHIEVCSPGEFSICRELQVSPGKMIYSGVMKEETDIAEALTYGADLITAESIRHFELIRDAAAKLKKKVSILLRLSSGNQFGMSVGDIRTVLTMAEGLEDLHIAGLHYYSGTAKKKKQVEADIGHLAKVLHELKAECGFTCELLEYGPGLSAEYFAGTADECETKDMELLAETAPLINELSERINLSIELGRFIAAPCGTYETAVKDLKTVGDVDYMIVDGGTHQVKYFGPNAAMKIPPIEQDHEGSKKEYMICGSLCTTADVLVRNVSLSEVSVGDVLRFKRTGAYSVTEGPVLFLSRRLPEIYVSSQAEGRVLIRKGIEAYSINKGQSLE
ncbi:MAG: alanine racemase [Lachnospiraceae bacterium]|nr:alanine racemase [Lachnospiraceae bacterium]